MAKLDISWPNIMGELMLSTLSKLKCHVWLCEKILCDQGVCREEPNKFLLLTKMGLLGSRAGIEKKETIVNYEGGFLMFSLAKI